MDQMTAASIGRLFVTFAISTFVIVLCCVSFTSNAQGQTFAPIIWSADDTCDPDDYDDNGKKKTDKSDREGEDSGGSDTGTSDPNEDVPEPPRKIEPNV